MTLDSTFSRRSSSNCTTKLKLNRRQEFVHSNQQVIEILSADLITTTVQKSGIMPLWIEVLRGLFQAWQLTLKNNTPQGEVHSPTDTVNTLEPWVNRLYEMDIISKTKNLDMIEKTFPGSKRMCAETLNDFSVALSEIKPTNLENLQKASKCISASRSILDREIYMNNQKLINDQIGNMKIGS
tara:strand:+ start:1940 stop:2488 length:549 start_codon:yes stop_codon:yes gene_type:complete